eukprot:364228-Chlamydomonas_euryale.AAC.8
MVVLCFLVLTGSAGPWWCCVSLALLGLQGRGGAAFAWPNWVSRAVKRSGGSSSFSSSSFSGSSFSSSFSSGSSSGSSNTNRWQKQGARSARTACPGRQASRVAPPGPQGSQVAMRRSIAPACPTATCRQPLLKPHPALRPCAGWLRGHLQAGAGHGIAGGKQPLAPTTTSHARLRVV